MILGIKKKRIKKELTPREYYNKRNKILLTYDARGIGDILNIRMLFKNFKSLAPDSHITFACFDQYKELLQNHPYLDDVISSKNINLDNYVASYDITTTCIHYESYQMGKNTKHRAEIWADHCGIPLESKDMHLPIIKNEKIIEGGLEIKQLRGISTREQNKDGPSVLFSPLAFEVIRSLTVVQMKETVKFLKDKGLFVFVTHDTPIQIYQEMDLPMLIGNTLSDWMSYVYNADYVVTVDTATFHYAGGLGKPLTGIFTHVDGKLRGKFYDFVLVQKHRDNGDWSCGPCYNYLHCSHPKCDKQSMVRPCLTELNPEEIKVGIEKMLYNCPI